MMMRAPLFKVIAEMLNYVRIRTFTRRWKFCQILFNFPWNREIKVCNPFSNLIIWKWKILYKTPELTFTLNQFWAVNADTVLENVQAEWIVESNLHSVFIDISFTYISDRCGEEQIELLLDGATDYTRWLA